MGIGDGDWPDGQQGGCGGSNKDPQGGRLHEWAPDR
jgi:hypothetical protein